MPTTIEINVLARSWNEFIGNDLAEFSDEERRQFWRHLLHLAGVDPPPATPTALQPMSYDEARAWGRATKMEWGKFKDYPIIEVDASYLDSIKTDHSAEFRAQLRRYLASEYFKKVHDHG